MLFALWLSTEFRQCNMRPPAMCAGCFLSDCLCQRLGLFQMQVESELLHDFTQGLGATSNCFLLIIFLIV